MGLFGGGNSTSTTQNNALDGRVASQSGDVLWANNSNVTQNVQSTDMGSIQRAFDTADAAVVGSALVSGTLGSQSLNGMQSVAEKAIDSTTKTIDANTAVTGGVLMLGSDLVDMTKGLLTGANKFASQAFNTGADLAATALDAVRSNSSSSLTAVQNAYSGAFGALQKASTQGLDTVAAASQRATDAVAKATTTQADTTSGNRTLYIAGAVIAAVALMMIYGRRKA